VRMNMDDSRLIAQFQRLITEMLVEKRLGQRRSGKAASTKLPSIETCCREQISTLCGSQDW
jgi:hypothetical protein